MSEAKPQRRWLEFAPDRFVVGLAVVELTLWLSERLQWFPFYQHKGWRPLIATAAAVVSLLVLQLWFGTSLAFRWRFQFGIRSLLIMAFLDRRAGPG